MLLTYDAGSPITVADNLTCTDLFFLRFSHLVHTTDSLCTSGSSPAPIDILYEIRQQKPELLEKMEVYVDGGVKHGTDVVRERVLSLGR